MPKKLNTQEFTEKAIEVHKNRYDYSKVRYVGSKEKVTITCTKHGDFQQIPNVHLGDGGCLGCGRDRVSSKLRSSTSSFIGKAKAVHGDKYDYSKVEYVTNFEKITIVCPIHGEFQQAPNSHLNKRGCYPCSILRNQESLSRSTKSFIEDAIKLHGDKYDYSKVVYTGSQGKVKIGCKNHGLFSQKAYKHIAGQGCGRCSQTVLSNTEDFIEKAILVHRERYDYSKVDYVNSSTEVVIICAEHGAFEKKPADHLQGGGCQKDNKSRGHVAVRFKLEDLGVDFIEEWRNPDCKYIRPLPFDFFVPSLGLLIEFDGDQHRRPSYFYAASEEQALENFKSTQIKDQIKTQWSKDAGYTLIRIDSIPEVDAVLTQSLIDNLRNKVIDESRKECMS